MKWFCKHSISMILVCSLCVQFFLWNGFGSHSDEATWQGTKSIKPTVGKAPEPVEEWFTPIASLGDKEFFFRFWALKIQNAGDLFTIVTPLKDYNYEHLHHWWMKLDNLNATSNLIPTLASNYFSASQTPKLHVPYVVDYLDQHAARDPEKKWWWWTMAVYHAKHKLEDVERASTIASKLINLPQSVDMPIWARQLGALMYEEQGEYRAACDAMLQVIDNSATLEAPEMEFIMTFINNRIGKMLKEQDKSKLEGIDPRCFSLLRWKQENQHKIKPRNADVSHEDHHHDHDGHDHHDH